MHFCSSQTHHNHNISTVDHHSFTSLCDFDPQKKNWMGNSQSRREANKPLTNHMWVHVCFISQVFPPPLFFFCISGNQTDLSLWVADDRVTCEGWARKKKKKRKKIWIYFKMQIIITEVSRRSIILGRWSAPSSSSCTHTYTEREGGGVLLVAFLVTQLVMANTQKKYRMEPHRKINLS